MRLLHLQQRMSTRERITPLVSTAIEQDRMLHLLTSRLRLGQATIGRVMRANLVVSPAKRR